MITLRQLSVFVEAVRAGSFRRCGEMLGMSQVSVSEHVRALEGRWGVKLFERKAGSLPVITDHGRLAYDRALAILSEVADLEMQFVAEKGAKRRVPLAMHTYMMRNLYPWISSFELEHGVSIDLDIGLNRPVDLAARVAERDLDLAYFFAVDESDVPGSTFIRDEALAIFVARDHPFASRDQVALEELAREPAAQTSKRDPLSGLINRAFATCGIEERAVGLETDDFGLFVSFVTRNRAYACLFASTPNDAGITSGLVPIRLDRPLPPLQVRLAARRTAHSDPVLRAIMQDVPHSWE